MLSIIQIGWHGSPDEGLRSSAMLTSAGVAAYRVRIDEDVAAALNLFEGERFVVLRERIRAEGEARHASLLAAELTLPQDEWSDELVKALVHPEPLLLFAADEAGIGVP
jgi:hypothetical protein